MPGPVVDLGLVLFFLRQFIKPFNKWEAFKLGIIDEKGKVLRKRKELKTSEEKKSFGLYDVLILNMKKMLAVVPGGASRLGTIAAAMALFLKEEQIEELVRDDQLLKDTTERMMEHFKGSRMSFKQYISEDAFSDVMEDVNEMIEERDYRKEYDNYHSKPEQKKKRASRNAARKIMDDKGKTRKGYDVHHKDNNPLNNDPKNLAMSPVAVNRAEPRLRGESIERLGGKWTDDKVNLLRKFVKKGWSPVKISRSLGALRFSPNEVTAKIKQLGLKEDAPSNAVGDASNVAGLDSNPPGPRKKKKKEVRDDTELKESDSFMGCKVFDVNFDCVQKTAHGKVPAHRYSKYVGEDEVGENIRQYGRKNPKKGIILRDNRTKAMVFLRRGKHIK